MDQKDNDTECIELDQIKNKLLPNEEEQPAVACNTNVSSKKQGFILGSILVACVATVGIIFLLLKIILNAEHKSTTTTTTYLVLPSYSHNDSISAELKNLTDFNNWRLDTANNYTSDLTKWRDDFNEPKERHYYFNITMLEKVNANGATRNLTVINSQYPGPLVEANSGDTIYLHVLNMMKDEPVSFHFHGLFYPNNTFDDGASSINVCPIPAGGNYTYKIPIGKEEFGTYWYHSHWSTQYADGIYGPVIIHSPEEDQKLDYYDADRIYVANDYYYVDADTLLPDYLTPDNENTEPVPNAGLISGTYSQSTTYFTPNTNDTYQNAIYFDPKKTWRVRVANVGFFMPFQFSIDEHKFKIVEVEGTLIEPLESDYVIASVGERYSFFMNRTVERDAYWVHARFNQFCLATTDPGMETDVMAIVSYNDKFEIPESSQTWQYDGGSPKCLDFPENELKTLDKTVPLNVNGSNRPDMYVPLDVTFFEKGYQMTYGYFNEYTWKSMPNSSVMHELMFNEEFRTNAHIDNTPVAYNGQYVLNFDTRGMIVDLIINNFDDGAHPFHLHGYKFWVISDYKGGLFYPSFYDKHPERLNLENPILRDTISVAPFGFAVLRFVVDNPGVFPFHCHIGWHIEAGLLLHVNALESEWSQQSYNPEWASMCGYNFADPWYVETEKY